MQGTLSNHTPSVNKWGVLLAVGAGTFMSALDTSVVYAILPLVRRSLHSNVASTEWIVTVYLLVVSGLLLSFGRLGDLWGHKTVYISGFGIFVVSSALCGLASSVTALVIFRGVQALGAAMLASNSSAILTKNFPAAQRGQALGMQATMTYLGLAVGPSLGGWLAQSLSWRLVFTINIPIGLLALAIGLRFIPSDRPERVEERFDRGGAATFIVGLVALLLVLNRGYTWGWTSAATLGVLALAFALLLTFIRIERRSAAPMLDLNLFRSTVFSLSIATAVVNYICVNSVIFLMPHYLIDGRGFDPSHAGLILAAQTVVMAVMAPLSGTLSDRIGVRLPSTIGMGILVGGLFLLARFGAATPVIVILLSLAVLGLGTGVFISPNNSAVMGSAPRNRQGVASGMLATARNFGMVLGVGLSGAIYTSILGPVGDEVASPALFRAIQTAFHVAMGIAVLGVLLALARKTVRRIP